MAEENPLELHVVSPSDEVITPGKAIHCKIGSF